MKRKFIYAAVFLFIVAGPFFRTVKGLDDDRRIFLDEHFWIPTGNIVFNNFFIENDFRYSTWNKEYYSWGNYYPTVGKFIIGFSIYLWGDATWQAFPPVDEKTLEVREIKVFPDKKTLFAARLPGYAMTFLFYLLVFVMVSSFAGLVPGALATYLISHNLLIQYLSRLVVTDFYMLFFGLASTFLAIIILRDLGKKPLSLVLSVYTPLAGIFAGFCIGSKLNGFLSIICLVPIGIISGIWSPYLKGRQRFILPATVISLISTVAMTLFILSNPFLYKDTVNGLKHMLSHKKIIVELNTQDNISVKEKFTVVIGELLLHDYNVIRIPGFRKFSVLLNLYLACAGVFFLCLSARKNIRAGNTPYSNGTLMMLCWCLVYMIGTLWWIPKAWHRFVLPAMFPLAILEAIGFVNTVRLMFVWIGIDRQRFGFLGKVLQGIYYK